MAKKLSAGRATASAISTSSVAGIEGPDPAPPPRIAFAMLLLVWYVAGSSTPRDGPAGRISRVTREQEEVQELARSGLRQGARLERLPSGRPTISISVRAVEKSGRDPPTPGRELPVVVFRHVSRFRLRAPTHRRASPWTMLAAAARPALPALASRAPAIRGARSATRVSASAEGTAFWDKMVAKASGKTTTTEVALFALG